jgi:hypothetical protein
MTMKLGLSGDGKFLAQLSDSKYFTRRDLI